jgi:hypothetical protein
MSAISKKIGKRIKDLYPESTYKSVLKTSAKTAKSKGTNKVMAELRDEVSKKFTSSVKSTATVPTGKITDPKQIKAVTESVRDKLFKELEPAYAKKLGVSKLDPAQVTKLQDRITRTLRGTGKKPGPLTVKAVKSGKRSITAAQAKKVIKGAATDRFGLSKDVIARGGTATTTASVADDAAKKAFKELHDEVIESTHDDLISGKKAKELAKKGRSFWKNLAKGFLCGAVANSAGWLAWDSIVHDTPTTNIDKITPVAGAGCETIEKGQLYKWTKKKAKGTDNYEITCEKVDSVPAGAKLLEDRDSTKLDPKNKKVADTAKDASGLIVTR